MTAYSPSVVTLSRFLYQAFRGLHRSFSLDLPSSMSQVRRTSPAVNGLPSCHSPPSRSHNVSWVPSSLHDQRVARSGTIEFRLFCGWSCLYMTRLLKTPIIGTTVEYVASSWMDMLAGLSQFYIFRNPPRLLRASRLTNHQCKQQPTSPA